MTLWIDADACPRPVRDIMLRAARRRELQLILVANSSLGLPPAPGVRQVVVPGGADVADLYILEHAEPGDLVVTADIPLADGLVTRNITAINPRVEASSRTLLVRAGVSNPEEQLLPGMFAELNVLLPDVQPRVVVPETAINFSLYGHSVYVVVPTDDQGQAQEDGEQALQVKRRFVTTGERRDGQVVVLEGLEDGDQVVSAGQLKLNDGAAVVINNSNPL